MVADDKKIAQKPNVKESFQERANRKARTGLEASKFITGEENSQMSSDEYLRQNSGQICSYDHFKQPGTNKYPDQVEAMAQALEGQIQQNMQKDTVQQVGALSTKYASFNYATNMITGTKGDQIPKAEDAIEDLANRKMAARKVATKSAAKSWPISDGTVELISDNSDLPLPPQMELDEYDRSIAAEKKACTNLGSIPEDGPPLPPQMQFGEHEHSIATKKKAYTNANLITVDGPPVPYQMLVSEFDDSLEKAKGQLRAK